MAVGGMVGALARWGAQETWPAAGDAIPWTTLTINVSGCLLIGLLLAWVATGRAPTLSRPFLGTGVLGGFTTFSAYALDVRRLLDEGQAGLAATYLLLTVVAALLAVVAGTLLGERLLRGRA